jgi:hypothetical protein
MTNKFTKILVGTLLAVVLATGSTSAAMSWSRSLKVGSRGADVKDLQMFLNMCADTKVANSGAGSPGMETTYFGPATKAAVIKFQAARGVSPQSGLFGPLSRAKAAELQASSNVCGGGVVVTPPNQTGPVMASLATNNPASGTLVAGQATADLAHFTFSGTGTVTAVSLKRIGVSADSTPSNVYLFDGATRLTDAASVGSNGTVTFNMPSGIFMVNGLKTISVKSDIAASTSGQTVGFMLATFATPAGVVSANLSGNIHSIAQATLASVSAGTVTPSGATLNPGAAVTVWQSTLNVSQRDVWMKRLSLRNVGSAPANAFANFKLYVNGVQVATSTGLDMNGYVTFDMMSTPVMLTSGSRVVRVDADIVSGASRTVQFSLRNAADVDFVDSSFGVNITPTSAPWGSSSANTISGTSGGTMTVERATTSPSTNVVLGGNDVTIGVYKLTAFGESIKVETLTAGMTFTDGGAANAAATLRNGKILVSTDGTNWTQYGSTATLVPAGTSYTLNYTVMPGTPVWVKVNADIYDNDGTGTLDTSDTILSRLIVGSSNAQKVDSLGTLNVPTATVDANTLSVASATATLAKNTTYANQTVTLPATNFKIGSWNLSGSSVEDILLTTMSFDVDESVGTEFDEGDLTNIYAVVKSGNTVVAQPSPLSTGSTGADLNFSINYTLMKNTNITIELFANLADDGQDDLAGVNGASDAIDSTDAFITDLTVTGTAMTSGSAVTATAADTTGQVIAYGAASITATADASNPVAAITYDNQTVTTLAAKFAAVTAAYNVTDLTVTVTEASAVSSVDLYDGATLVASKPGATSVVFSGLNWNVPANTNKVLTVKLVLGTVGIGAGNTGATITTAITAFTAVNTSTGVSAAGTVSSPNGNAMYVYAATPTITNVALPESTLSNGTKTVSKFAVSSNGGTIGWKYLAFTITKVMSGTDTLASATLWDADTNTQIAGTATFTGSVEVDNDTAGGLTFVATNEQQINGTKNYVLKMVVAGATTSGDYLSVSIAQPLVAYDAPDLYADVLTDDATATFVWTDQSLVSHSETTEDWNHGYLVKNLPTDTQTLTY